MSETAIDPLTDCVEKLTERIDAQAKQVASFERLHHTAHDRLDVHVEQLAALSLTVEDLTAGGVATVSKPTVRVRINHKRTEKRGWEVSETTIERTGASIDEDMIRAELRLAYLVGVDEAGFRNDAESGGAS